MPTKKSDTFDRRYATVIHYITSFCMTHIGGDARASPSIYGFRSDFFGDRVPEGSLCVLQSAPISEWQVSFYIGEDKPGHHLLESAQTGRVCRWTNVSVNWLDDERANGHWRWSDRQYDINDRWLRACRKGGTSYFTTVPTYAEFDGDTVVLKMRRKFDQSGARVSRSFEKWWRLKAGEMRTACAEMREEMEAMQPQ